MSTEVTNVVTNTAEGIADAVAESVDNVVAEMVADKVAHFDDVGDIIDDRMIGTFIVRLSDVDVDAFKNSREEDPAPAAILGIQNTLGTVEDSLDTGNQIQEVSVGFYEKGVDEDDLYGLGAYAGFTRMTAMKRITLKSVIESFNDAMGYHTPNDEGYIVPDGRGVSVEVYDKEIMRIIGASSDWATAVAEAMDSYAVRIRTSDVSNKAAYIRSIIENNQRSNPSTGAKAAGCAFMRSEYKMTGKEISDDTGLLQAHVSQYLLVADIPTILLAIVEDEIDGGGTVEDTQRELLARCIEEWGRRTYMLSDDSCAILISHARVLGPALRGYKKNSVDLTAALSLMCELCRIDEDSGKVNRKEPRPDLATFTTLVNSAKEYGAPEEVSTELASDEVASMIAMQGGIPGDSAEIDDILGHIADDGSITKDKPAGDSEADGSGVDISAIVSAGEANESGVADTSDAPDTPADAEEVNAVNDADTPEVDAAGAVDFADLGDLGGLEGEDGDDFSMPSDDELAASEAVTGERNVGSIDADDIADATVESKPRSTLIRKAERSLMLIHTAYESEGADESDDPVMKVFGCRPGVTLVQLATSAALSDAANDGGKEELNLALSKFLDGVDAFLAEVITVAADKLNSADFTELCDHAKKIDLDTIV